MKEFSLLFYECTLKLLFIHFSCQKSDIIRPKREQSSSIFLCGSKGKRNAKKFNFRMNKTLRSLYTHWVSTVCNCESCILMCTDFIIVMRLLTYHPTEFSGFDLGLTPTTMHDVCMKNRLVFLCAHCTSYYFGYYTGIWLAVFPVIKSKPNILCMACRFALRTFARPTE